LLSAAADGRRGQGLKGKEREENSRSRKRQGVCGQVCVCGGGWSKTCKWKEGIHLVALRVYLEREAWWLDSLSTAIHLARPSLPSSSSFSSSLE
jgi:hypothetical protein